MMRLRLRTFRSKFTAAAILLAGALRFAHLGAPLTSDESYTIRNYAQMPLRIIATKYNAPNNHLLVSVMLHLIDAAAPKKIFLTLADIHLLQFPSIAASVLALVLLYLIAAELTGTLAAALAVVALGVSFWHLIYSHMLRGYSLSVFFNLLNLWLVLRILERKIWPLWMLPLALAATHYLIPLNACYTLALAALRFSDLTRHRHGALPATLSEQTPPASRTITRHPFEGNPATAG
jgi:hypothetical protein